MVKLQKRKTTLGLTENERKYILYLSSLEERKISALILEAIKYYGSKVLNVEFKEFIEKPKKRSL